jgi:metal-responsive CopG/Arc/MetJ family transcriptional regulator
MNIPDELLSQIDLITKDMYINRTSFVIMALNDYIASLKFQSLMGDLSEAIQRLGTKGNNDEATIKDIEKLLYAIKMIKGK